MYPKELFRNNHYRVVFGPEEEAEFKAKGWKAERVEGQKYVGFDSGIPEDVPEEAPERRRPGRPKKTEPDSELNEELQEEPKTEPEA